VGSSTAIVGSAVRLAARVADEAFYAAMCVRAGMVGLEPPHRLAALALTFERYGALGTLPALAAARHRHQPAIVDELGELTYGEMNDRINALATAWVEEGLEAGDGVGILCRNHRGLPVALFAAARCGARIVLLNTGFSGPQIREVCERESVDLLVYDEEFTRALGDFTPRKGRVRGWLETRVNDDDTLIALITSTPPKPPPKPRQPPRLVILTSGTTGTPKGANREAPLSLAPAGGLLSKVPFRAREATQLCAPVFHALGFSGLVLGISLGSTMAMSRKFDPVEVLDSLEHNRCSALILVPVVLQRLLAQDEAEFRGRDFSSLRVILASGSQLSGDLARRTAERFGPVLYNLYGSTEVAYGTIATPRDLARAPGTAGRVVHGARVRILDEHGVPLPPGRTGRVFVGNLIPFEGYTGGGDKLRVDGLLATGDLGHFDHEGHLFIDGRDDEMIISGGENVYPAEVEELLAAHPAVLEVAVVGMPDEAWGQALKAFVVRRPGHALTAEEVRDHVRDNLARYKVPREVEFLPSLPRNATGKVLKRELV
jgi:fatty-acyl-CoA synthase